MDGPSRHSGRIPSDFGLPGQNRRAAAFLGPLPGGGRPSWAKPGGRGKDKPGPRERGRSGRGPGHSNAPAAGFGRGAAGSPRGCARHHHLQGPQSPALLRHLRIPELAAGIAGPPRASEDSSGPGHPSSTTDRSTTSSGSTRQVTTRSARSVSCSPSPPQPSPAPSGEPTSPLTRMPPTTQVQPPACSQHGTRSPGRLICSISDTDRGQSTLHPDICCRDAAKMKQGLSVFIVGIV